MKGFGKAIYWLLLVTFLGLLQVWIIIFTHFILKETIGFEQLMLNGYFLFFSISLLSLFFTDQALSYKKVIRFKQREFAGFIIFPMIIIIISVVLHIISFQYKGVDTDRICSCHYAIYTMTFLFALTYKTQQIKEKL